MSTHLHSAACTQLKSSFKYNFRLTEFGQTYSVLLFYQKMLFDSQENQNCFSIQNICFKMFYSHGNYVNIFHTQYPYLASSYGLVTVLLLCTLSRLKARHSVEAKAPLSRLYINSNGNLTMGQVRATATAQQMIHAANSTRKQQSRVKQY